MSKVKIYLLCFKGCFPSEPPDVSAVSCGAGSRWPQVLKLELIIASDAEEEGDKQFYKVLSFYFCIIWIHCGNYQFVFVFIVTENNFIAAISQ